MNPLLPGLLRCSRGGAKRRRTAGAIGRKRSAPTRSHRGSTRGLSLIFAHAAIDDPFAHRTMATGGLDLQPADQSGDQPDSSTDRSPRITGDVRRPVSQPTFVLPALTTDERGMITRREHDDRALDGRIAGARALFFDSGRHSRDGFTDAFLQTQLRRVFARAGPDSADAAMTVSRSRQETLLVQRSLQFTQRVVDERRRMEEQHATLAGHS